MSVESELDPLEKHGIYIHTGDAYSYVELEYLEYVSERLRVIHS